MISSSSSASLPEIDSTLADLPAIASADDLMHQILRSVQRHSALGSSSHLEPLPSTSAWQTGEAIGFGAGASGGSLLVKGWSYPEAGYVWSDGNTAEMLIPGYPRTGATLLNFKLSPFCYAPGITQNVRIYSESRLAGVWDFAHEGSACLILPRPAREDQPIQLLWEFPNARSPREVGLNGDPRRLAVALFSVSFFCLKSLSAGSH